MSRAHRTTDGADRSRSRSAALATAAALATLGTVATLPVIGHAASPPGFTHVNVDPNLAGGEPFVSFATGSGGTSDLVYSSHEGTTHLFRDGIVSADTGNLCATPQTPPQSIPGGFVCSYTNQVNVWTSGDQGSTWTRTTVGPNGVGPTSPFGLGFSDPDLTQDEGGYLYDTGIDLANDAVFASTDGGKSFPIGNNNCHEGDRPWLAGGASGEVFLATDTAADANTSLSSGHEIFRGVVGPLVAGVGTITCYGAASQPNSGDPAGVASTGIPDFGTATNGHTYSAEGKLFYDHNSVTPSDGAHGALIDPISFGDGGIGISVLKNADAAFASTTPVGFTQYELPNYTHGIFAHWPSIAVDSNDVVYETWDTNVTDKNGNLANAIMLATFDLKTLTWSTPITIAQPGTSVLWPWVAVGSPGNAAVVWYQYDQLTNPDAGAGNVSLLESSVFGAGNATPTIEAPVDAVGAPIHTGGLCQSGTTCVATGQDRRLGDFFTDAVDQNGCVMIATGETTTDPSAATSRPMFIKQTNGTGLTGQSCVVASTNLPEVPLASLLLVGGAGAAVVLVARRRRRSGWVS